MECNCGTQCLTHKMAGVGPAGGLMIVGQGPGGEEDMAGRPFVGRAGKLLRAMLTDAGIDPDEIFYTNATRCRLPENRKPTNSEIEAGRDDLRREIESIRPTCIIALGDSALQSLCKTSGISSKRGRSLPLHNDYGYSAEVWPVYHPAYVLRVPQVRDTVVADLRRIRDRGKAPGAVPWSWYPAYDNRVIYPAYDNRVIFVNTNSYYGDPPIYAWDIETDYDRKVKGSGTKITQVAVTRHNEVIVFHENDAPRLAGNTVTHNGWMFDVPMMHRNGFKAVPWGRDTMVMAYLDDETQPLGLEALCVKYLGVPGWKEDKQAELGSDEFAAYNARDAWYTLKLHDVLLEKLGDRIKIADKIILPAYLALRAASERGTYIDHIEINKFLRAERDLKAVALAKVKQDYGINPGSPAQVGEVLGLPSTGAAILQKIDHPLARAVLQYRKASKSVATLEKYDKMDRAHPEYLLWRTVTGRSSCKNPNVQNLDRQYKSIFSAPPGRVRISADYSAIEFRLAAWVANEETILMYYGDDPAWDPHTWFASHLYQKYEAAVTKAERQVAKSANFSQLYMGGPSTLINYAAKQGVPLSFEDAVQINRTWHAKFPGFRRLYKATAHEIATLGYVETATGRRRHFGRVGLGFSGEDALRQGVNMKVQSLALDLAAAALARLHELNVPITDFIHDSIAVEVPDTPQDIAEVKLALEKAMCRYAPLFLKENFGVDLTNIPLTIDTHETRTI